MADATTTRAQHDAWVVVPAFDEGVAIGHCVVTLREAFANVVVVDDGSADDTGTIVAAFAARHPAVELLRHERRGAQVMGPAVVSGFRFAYRRSRAEQYSYVSKFDADQVFPPDYCAGVLRYLDAHPAVGVAGGRGPPRRAGPSPSCGRSSSRRPRPASRR